MRCSKARLKLWRKATDALLKLGRSFAYSDNKEIEMYGEFLRKEIKKNILRNNPNRTFI